MEALDGNVLAGALHEYFGREMTSTTGQCSHCGTRAVLAELSVYGSAPGAVVRCRACGDVVMVVLDIRGRVTVDQRHFTLA